MVVEKWDARPRRSDEAMYRQLRRAEPHLHDGRLGRPWLVQADPPARGHARPDGQPEGRDHRAPDQGQLHGRPDGARVLHLDPRRPQGPRGHGPAHRGLRLPDAASRRRRPGRDHPRARLRHEEAIDARAVQHGGRAERQPHRAHRGRGHRHQARARRSSRRAARSTAPSSPTSRVRRRGARRDRRALGAQVRGRHRRVPGLLRPLDGDRQDRPDRRRGGHHRRPVDRRAGHAADHADVPHRRRRRRGHHARPAARRGAVRGAQAEGPGEDRRAGRHRGHRGDRQGAHRRHHRRRRRGAPLHVPAPHAPVRRPRARRSRRARSSTRGRCTRTSCWRSGAGPRPSSTSSRRSRRSTSPRAWTSTTSTSS